MASRPHSQPRSSADTALAAIAERRGQVERLTSRQRALAAIHHEEGDRVPIDFWAAAEVQRDLAEHFGCTYADLLELLGVDFRYHPGPAYRGVDLHRHADGTVSDLWGVRRRTINFEVRGKEGSYRELAESPLVLMTSVREIDEYRGWPSADWWDFCQVGEECGKFAGKCVVFAGDRLDRTSQLKTMMYLRGVEQALTDLILHPALVDCMLDHITTYYLEYNKRVFDAARLRIDVFMMGDDFGTQTSPFMRASMWQQHFEPAFRQYIDLAHRYGIKVMHHTCGAVGPLIPRFIDAGLDILQSLQPRANGMDLGKLKKEYGRDLAFHGSVDIQHTLPNGTPAETEEEVLLRLRVGKPGGGFIICTAHNIQRDVPIENTIALLQAYHRFSAY